MSFKNYQPTDIETKWQKRWQESKIFQVADFSKKKKYYILEEFPYCSGEGLHIGHAFTNVIGDVLARKKRMTGFNVLHPMGWDSFGLPTENSAIKTGIQPAVLTARNTQRFHQQNDQLGISYDWSREIDTSNPDYYKWTQWIFLQFFKHGLAYKAETPVGWCPKCKIILANEEIVSGKCERCGEPAEYRRQKQWLLKITAYADRLADELDLVDYPDYVKKSQRDWIGRKNWTDIDYPVIGTDQTLTVATTRPETNFGATFIVIAPEHDLLKKLKIENSKLKIAIDKYIKLSQNKSELERTELQKEKTGVFTGYYVLNRLNNKKLPIWVADFVVLTTGTGAVVGVPAHDKRDFDFAKKYQLEIVPVIQTDEGKEEEMINSDFLNGLTPIKAINKINDYLVKKGWGKQTVRYHLRDWIFSRQHYWGEPIPIIYCPKCGMIPVPEKDLPVKLPEVDKYEPTDTGESPLANIREWVEVACPECNGAARRETDTMPNWAGSSWYYLAYTFASKLGIKNLKFKIKNLEYWLPVDLYLGGAEHNTLHLLYSRFWHKFLNDLNLVPGKEPYAARRQHGVILGEDGFRMSKSRGNVVNPDEIIKKFGADTLRLYLLFMGPYNSTMPWNVKGLEGCYRFLGRVWRLVNQNAKVKDQKYDSFRMDNLKFEILERKLNQTTKKVGEDIEQLKYNTAIASLMELLNVLTDNRAQVTGNMLETFTLLLAPFVPHLAEEIWVEILKKPYSVHQQSWPKYDPKLIQEKIVTIVVQINGKVRSQLNVKSEMLNIKSEIEQLAKKDSRVIKYLSGQKIINTFFVPGRLINFVVG